MRTLKAIIFDMDGTLADTEEIHRQSFNSAFDEFGIACHWSQTEYKELLSVSGGRERIRQYLHRHHLAEVDPGSLAEFAFRIHTRKSEIYRQRLVDGHIGLRPGIRRLINEALDQDISLAIATSSSTRNAETLLKVALGNNALSLFKTIVTCDIVETQKPSPAIYRHALEVLQTPPGHCIAIEDTHNGNMAALAAGLTTIITTHMFTVDDDFSGASLVVNQLGEPGDPPVILQGNACDSEYVDLSLLDRIISDSHKLELVEEAGSVLPL